jgi:hypothetical protein
MKEDKDRLSLEKRENKKEKNNHRQESTIIHQHASLYKKEDTTTHQTTKWKGMFGHRMYCTCHPNTADDTYLSVREHDGPTPFSNKIIVSQHRNTTMLFMNLRITKNP